MDIERQNFLPEIEAQESIGKTVYETLGTPEKPECGALIDFNGFLYTLTEIDLTENIVYLMHPDTDETIKVPTEEAVIATPLYIKKNFK